MQIYENPQNVLSKKYIFQKTDEGLFLGTQKSKLRQNIASSESEPNAKFKMESRTRLHL